MKGIVKKVFILFLTITTIITISACGKKKDKKKDVKTPNINLWGDNLNEKELFSKDNLKELEIENPDALCNAYMDVEPDFELTLITNTAYNGLAEINDSIVAKDAFENVVELDTAVQYRNGDTAFIVKAKAEEGYERGSAYPVSIINNENLIFENRDASVRKVIFTIRKDDTSNFELLDDYKTYDMDKISYFSGYGDYNTYLIYDGKLDCKVGEIIVFSNDAKDDIVYIRVKKVESNKSTTKIYYDCPEAKDMFNDLELHVDQKEINVEENIHLYSKEEIIQSIKDSAFAEQYIAYAAYLYNFDEELLADNEDPSFWDHVYIDLSATADGSRFTVLLTLQYTFTTSKGWRIIIQFNYKYQTTYKASGDAKLKTFLGIPYGAEMNCSLSSDVSHSLEFRVCLCNPIINEKEYQKPAKDVTQEDAFNVVNKIIEHWGEYGKDYMRNKVVGDTLMLNIGFLAIHVGPIAFEFDLYLCFKLSLNISIGAGYNYSYHKVIINYSTDKDTGDGEVAPSSVGVHTIQASFVGKVGFEVFIKLRFSFYIIPIKKLLCLYVDVDAGFYIDASVKGQMSYDITTDTGNLHGGLFLEFGLFVRLTLNADIIGFVHLNWTLIDARLPFYKVSLVDLLDKRINPDTIEIDSYETPIMNTDLLTYATFDTVALAEISKTYEPNAKAKIFESCFCDPLEIPLFANFSSDDYRIKIVDNNIVVKAGTSEVTANITFTVFPAGYGTQRTETVRVHFRAKEAKDFSIDGKKVASYLSGQTIELPKDVEYREGYIFKGYVYNGQNITSMDTITMGNEDINITTRYIEDRTYTVKYYDGFNNLVYTEEVLNEEKAVGPDVAIRDANMDSDYVFIGWDRNLDSITKDIEVHGVYLKGSEII